MRARLPLVCLLVLSAACMKSTPAADTTKVADTTAKASDDQAKSDIEKIRNGWKDAANKKDSATIANYYADDAVMAVPEAPVAEGKAAIEATLGRMVNMTTTKGIDSKKLVVSGDEAYDYGTYSQTATLPGGKTADQNGYYIVTLHKGSDGVWKITHHLGVSPPVGH